MFKSIRSRFKRKRFSMRKLYAIFLATIVLVNSLGIHNIYAEGNKEELRLAVENRLSKFTGKTLSQYGGYLGVFYNMELILSQAIWIDFIQEDLKHKEGGLEIDQQTINHFRNDLREFVEKFNEVYANNEKVSEKEVKAIRIDPSWFYDEINLGALSKSYAQYINDYMKRAIPNEDTSDDDILKKHRKVFRHIYDIIDTTINTVKVANSFIPYKDEKQQSGAVKRTPNYEYSRADKFTDLIAIMDPTKSPEEQDKNKVSRLLRKSKELSEAELDHVSPDSINNNLMLLDRFYKEGTFTSGQLLNSYYMMFASSAVYDPFVSKVGDDYFIAALKQLSGEHGDDSALLKLYNEGKMYKKPLYYRELGKDGNPKGPAERITVSAFLDYIKEGRGGSLVLPVGMMAKDRDDNSYKYYKIDRFKHTADESVKNAQASMEDSSEVSKESDDKPVSPNAPEDEESTQLQDSPGTGNISSGDNTNNTANNSSSDGNDKVLEKTPHEMTKSEWEESIRDTQFIPDDTAITNETQLTPSVFTWGEYGNTLHMGTVVATNIVKDVAKIEKFKKDNRLIFMNAYGDIVTEDDIVIIPGAANPTFYNEGASYYPYTVGFLKSYPNLDAGTLYFKLQNSNEGGKYVISIVANADEEEKKANDKKDKENKEEDEKKEDKEINTVTKTIDGSEVGPQNEYEAFVRQVRDEEAVKMQIKKKLNMNIQGEMKEMGEGINSMLIFKFLQFSSKNLLEKNLITNFINNLGVDDTAGLVKEYEAFLIKTLTSSVSNDSLNVLYSSDLENLSDKELGAIAMNFYWGIMNDGSGSLTAPNDKLNTELLAISVLPETLNGTANAKAYSKDIMKDYDQIVEDTFNRFQIFIKDCVKSFIKTFKDIRGVLGMKSAYQDPVFGKLMVYSQLYVKYMVVGILLLVIFRFISNRASLGQATMVAGVVAIVAYLFTSVIPIYIPMVFNTIQNNASRDLSYIALGMKSENYAEVYSDRYDKDGRLLMSTTSVNLYKLNPDELKFFASKHGLEPTQIADGTATVIDSDSGIYLEGNIIKANVDKLFANHPITGRYVSNGKGGMYYEIKADKMVSSSLDYYTPYNLVVNNLISKINDLSKVYQLERSTLKYDGMNKDSFAFDAYTNSAPYLAPGRWDELSQELEPQVLDALKEVFGDNYDWLGVSSILVNPPEEAKDSLWYKTYLKNGYLYIPNSDASTEDIASIQKRTGEVIDKVNRLVKVFVEEHKEDFKGMSDENIIKIVSLYATTILNQEASNYTDMVYPLFLNFEELNLEDVLVATYSDSVDRLQSETINIVDFVAFKSGFMVTLLLGAVTFTTYAVTLIVTYLVPVLYVILGALLIIKFVRARSMKGMLNGYIKSSLIVFVCYAFSGLSFSIVYNFIDSIVAGLLFQLVIQLTILDTLGRLVLAIATNVGEVGNDKMHTVAPLLVRMTGLMDVADYLSVKAGNIMHKNKPNLGSTLDDIYDVFNMDSSIDELYDSSFMLKGKVRAQERNFHDSVNTASRLGTIDLDDLYDD